MKYIWEDHKICSHFSFGLYDTIEKSRFKDKNEIIEMWWILKYNKVNIVVINGSKWKLQHVSYLNCLAIWG